MFLREILRTLERVERNQERILGRLAAMERTPGAETDGKSAGSLIQQGIDSIMNYQAGKKREEQG